MGWLRFFSRGVRDTAGQAAETAQALPRRFAQDEAKIESLGRRAGSTHRPHQPLQRRLVVSVPSAAKEPGLSAPTVRSAVRDLENLGPPREITGKQRDRMYLDERCMSILNEGTEPPR